MRRLKVGLILHLTAFFVLASGNPDDVLVIEQIDVSSTKEIADLKVSFSFFDRGIDIWKRLKFFEQAFFSQKFDGLNNRLDEMERATKDLKNSGKLLVWSWVSVDKSKQLYTKY